MLRLQVKTSLSSVKYVNSHLTSRVNFLSGLKTQSQTLKRVINLKNYSSDVSKDPALNQFQNPNNTPYQFQPQNSSSPFPNNLGRDNPNGIPPNGRNPLSPPPPDSYPQPNRLSFKVRLLISAFATFCGTIAFLFLTEDLMDQLPDEIFEVLRKAMEAETRNDFETALKYYKEALVLCDEMELEELNQEYTGIALCIAHIYELQEKYNKALVIYEEIGYRIVQGLTLEYYEPEKKDRLITQGLVVFSRYARLLAPEDFEKAKSALRLMISIAEKRIVEYYPSLLPVLEGALNAEMIDITTQNLKASLADSSETSRNDALDDFFRKNNEVPLAIPADSQSTSLLALFAEGWPGYSRDLLAARDIYANICIDHEQYAEALAWLLKNTSYAMIGVNAAYNLTCSMSKLGMTNIYGREYAKKHLIEMIDNISKTENLVDQGYYKREISIYNAVLRVGPNNARDAFEKTLTFLATFRSLLMKRENPALPPQVAISLELSEGLCYHGLGIIQLQNGEIEEATENFIRARGVSNELGIAEWADNIDEILQVLKKYKDDEDENEN
ncbi:unnamed protein product [[Candida] boidinii]|uniref:Unnamed protein product n=1 Tax=Candida boidinii TaxID=5477 RepID=A0A9W6T1U6_CANBO|nr:hypothetical protein B5S30_g3362 [[Candida] boidinii]OWB83902.1 hypothetical protein B5S33_g2538 [[Candida] boidinii]GME73412.1 unnamed protein product [[Candida] boidinii]GMG00342.1 unnamed protein product [[Candida] boidinii]